MRLGCDGPPHRPARSPFGFGPYSINKPNDLRGNSRIAARGLYSAIHVGARPDMRPPCAIRRGTEGVMPRAILAITWRLWPDAVDVYTETLLNPVRFSRTEPVPMPQLKRGRRISASRRRLSLASRETDGRSHALKSKLRRQVIRRMRGNINRSGRARKYGPIQNNPAEPQVSGGHHIDGCRARGLRRVPSPKGEDSEKCLILTAHNSRR